MTGARYNTIPLAGRALTNREHDILCLLAEGYSQPAMAPTLHVSESCIKTNGLRLYAKLGATNGPHAVALGYQYGYLDAGAGIGDDIALIRKSREVGWQLALVPWTGPDDAHHGGRP